MRTPLLGVLSVAWAAALAAGIFTVERYAVTPSPPACAPSDWPEGSTITRASDARFHLVMFLHPKCPCSRASVEELNRLLAHFGDRLDTHAVMVIPPGFGDDWAKSDLYRAAAAIDGVKAHLDPAGIEARRFTAKTSGQVMLYGPDGRLLFEGGITGARGHAGDNQGRALLEHQLEHPGAETQRFLVFGCTLFSDMNSHERSET